MATGVEQVYRYAQPSAVGFLDGRADVRLAFSSETAPPRSPSGSSGAWCAGLVERPDRPEYGLRMVQGLTAFLYQREQLSPLEALRDDPDLIDVELWSMLGTEGASAGPANWLAPTAPAPGAAKSREPILLRSHWSGSTGGSPVRATRAARTTF